MTTLDYIKKFITTSDWLLAKSMPDAPHWYVLRNANNSSEFDLLVNHIHNNGVLRKWGSYAYLYLDIDSFTYWTLNNSEGEKVIINRAELKTAGSADVRQVFKKCPNCKRLTAESEYKKFTKTTNGVTRTFWRCPVCESFKQAAKKALLKSKT